MDLQSGNVYQQFRMRQKLQKQCGLFSASGSGRRMGNARNIPQDFRSKKTSCHPTRQEKAEFRWGKWEKVLPRVGKIDPARKPKRSRRPERPTGPIPVQISIKSSSSRLKTSSGAGAGAGAGTAAACGALDRCGLTAGAGAAESWTVLRFPSTCQTISWLHA